MIEIMSASVTCDGKRLLCNECPELVVPANPRLLHPSGWTAKFDFDGLNPIGFAYPTARQVAAASPDLARSHEIVQRLTLSPAGEIFNKHLDRQLLPAIKHTRAMG